LVACNVSNEKVYPLQVTYVKSLPTSPGMVSLWLENLNSECIEFPYDFGIKIYFYKNGEKIEIKNMMEYIPHDNITLGAKGEFFAERAVSFTPDLSNLLIDDSAHFLIQISGVMCKSGQSFTQEIPFTAK
jgi:hypothetical protein